MSSKRARSTDSGTSFSRVDFEACRCRSRMATPPWADNPCHWKNDVFNKRAHRHERFEHRQDDRPRYRHRTCLQLLRTLPCPGLGIEFILSAWCVQCHRVPRALFRCTKCAFIRSDFQLGDELMNRICGNRVSPRWNSVYELSSTRETSCGTFQ